MKKALLIISAMFITQFSLAKHITIVVRGNQPRPTGDTEVTTHGATLSDTLIVTPAKDASLLNITLKDANDNIYQSYCVPATCNDILSVISPSLPTGLMLEIRDDKGYIYREFD